MRSSCSAGASRSTTTQPVLAQRGLDLVDRRVGIEPRELSFIAPFSPIAAVTAIASQLGQVVVWIPAWPVGLYGSGLAPPANRSAIQWIMSGADGAITPAWLCPG